MNPSIPASSAGTLHRIHGTGRVVGGKFGRWYRCYGADNQMHLTARAFRNSKPLHVCFSGDAPGADLILKLRTSFPLTGKIDVWDTATNELVGVVTRGRKFYDAQEHLLGRFQDATSWKEHLGESLIDAVGQLIFGGADGQPSPGSHRFALTVDKRTIGSLTREQFSFFPDPPRRPRLPRVELALQRILPRNLGRALFDRTPPVGWKLEIVDPTAIIDWRLLWCAALMTVELRNW